MADMYSSKLLVRYTQFVPQIAPDYGMFCCGVIGTSRLYQYIQGYVRNMAKCINLHFDPYFTEIDGELYWCIYELHGLTESA